MKETFRAFLFVGTKAMEHRTAFMEEKKWIALNKYFITADAEERRLGIW